MAVLLMKLGQKLGRSNGPATQETLKSGSAKLCNLKANAV